MNARHLALAGAAGSLALVAACGGGSSGSSSASAAASDATAAASSAPAAVSSAPVPVGTDGSSGTPVAVTETSFHIALDRTTFTAGSYTFHITNASSLTHALTVDGPGADDVSSGSIHGGGSGTLTVTLQKGTYEIYCPVGDHKMEGMDLHITVT